MKEYEIFSKYIYTDTPGLMEEILKLRDYKHKVMGWKEELEEKEEKKKE